MIVRREAKKIEDRENMRDVVITGGGASHYIRNTGKELLVLTAVIVMEF